MAGPLMLSSKMKAVLKKFHRGSRGAHLGAKKTLERLMQSWVGCHQAVKDWITNYTQCIADKGPIRGGKGQPQQYSSGASLKKIVVDESLV